MNVQLHILWPFVYLKPQFLRYSANNSICQSPAVQINTINHNSGCNYYNEVIIAAVHYVCGLFWRRLLYRS